MQSTNFLVATVNKQFNMFTTSEDGTIQFIANIAEHVKRLEEISDQHHFYIDDAAYYAMNKSGVPLRFTRVFSKNPELLQQSTDYRLHNINELDGIVAAKERYSPTTQIFFIGSSEFLTKCQKYAKKLLLTVVDKEIAESTAIDNFPLEALANVYKKRREIKPELLEQIKKYKAIKMKQLPKFETEIAENGMKITKAVDLSKISIEDQILDTPDYNFYEYRK